MFFMFSRAIYLTHSLALLWKKRRMAKQINKNTWKTKKKWKLGRNKIKTQPQNTH